MFSLIVLQKQKFLGVFLLNLVFTCVCILFLFYFYFFFVRRQSLLIFVFPKECVSIRGQRVERVLKVKEYRVMRGGHCGF